MSKIERVLVTGKTHTTFSGSADAPRGQHSRLDIALSSSVSDKPGHAFEAAQPHPTAEQLFAGAWSACYTIAIAVVAQEMKVMLPQDTAVDIEVDLGMTGSDYFIQARFLVRLPGLPHDVATAIAHKADEICPYSKAVRCNIDVTFNVVT